MQNNNWVPEVLKDIEKYCFENDLLKVAFHLEDARRKFTLFQEEEKLGALSDSENVEPIRLVWSHPDCLDVRQG